MVKRTKSIHSGSSHRKLHCFVAMAFGKADTDAIYAKHISQAIIDAGLIPVRVDKVLHNERIDSKMRDLIRNADVAVADLTYARPSAYWEAGYAERKVPVVYTCRKDHLHPQSDDSNGNLQIHFDLRNANLITWSGNGNRQFRDTLRKRLLHVTAHPRADAEKLEQLLIERKKFLRLSARERIDLIDKETVNILEEKGFKYSRTSYSSKDTSRSSSYSEVSGRVTFSFYLKKIGSVAFIVLILPCMNQLSKTELKDTIYPTTIEFGLGSFALWDRLQNKTTRYSRKQIRAIRRLVIVPTVGKVSATRVEAVFPNWRKANDYSHYFNPLLETHDSDHKRGRKNDIIEMPSSSEFLIVDHIESTVDYRRALIEALDSLEKEKGTIITPR